MKPRVLIAGVGNIFFGDDGFGVEVARRLETEALPPAARVVDFGIRGLHLAFELLEPLDLLVLVDTARRGGPPGTLYLIEPADFDSRPADPDAHGMDIVQVFRMLEQLGGARPKTRIVACEPADLGAGLAMSQAIQGAIAPAVKMVMDLVEEELNGNVGHNPVSS